MMLDSLHPSVIAVWNACILVVAMFSGNPIFTVTALTGALLFSASLLPTKQFGKTLLGILPFFLLVIVTNPLFSQNGDTVLFTVWRLSVTKEALLYGVNLAGMLLSVLLWFTCHGKLMTEEKFLGLFGRIAPKTALVLVVTMRFLPLFRRRYREIESAQKVLGLYSGKSRKEKIKSHARMFLTLLSWSMESAMESADVMRAKEFGKAKRTTYTRYRFTSFDGISIGLCICLFGVTVWGVARGLTAFDFYPALTEIALSAGAVAGYVCYAMLCILPFLFRLVEVFKWNRYESKV